MFVKAPFIPEEALAYELPYFYNSGELNDTSFFLRIDGARKDSPKISVPVLKSSAFPKSIVAIKTATDIFVFADWPRDFPAEDRESLTQAIRDLLKGCDAGEYNISLLRE